MIRTHLSCKETESDDKRGNVTKHREGVSMTIPTLIRKFPSLNDGGTTRLISMLINWQWSGHHRGTFPPTYHYLLIAKDFECNKGRSSVKDRKRAILPREIFCQWSATGYDTDQSFTATRSFRNGATLTKNQSTSNGSIFILDDSIYLQMLKEEENDMVFDCCV
ncbi:hypothetical protein CDL15_Pgr005386 [Punica granatum]|uniref:Uncharacterized protein n=1 Tax=Punica granatum TaxID=22663 RepID=A0A218XE55_PUNGR|nr:hypothetical protein CDL15_Pgr005386 [Punica granatum]